MAENIDLDAPSTSQGAVAKTTAKGVCQICNIDEDDKIMFGPILEKEGVIAHYFCLLFSYRLLPNGDMYKDMIGYIPNEVKNYIKKYKSRDYKSPTCIYCNKIQATGFCAFKKCGKRFHIPCGMKNNALMQFCGEFQTYCDKHAEQMIVHQELPADDQVCMICLDPLGKYHPVSCFLPPCCYDMHKNHNLPLCWMHYKCAMKGAYELGYHFNCFAERCGRRNNYIKKLYKEHGIFIPRRDATYELEPDRYKDIDNSDEDDGYVNTTYDQDATILQCSMVQTKSFERCDYKIRCIAESMGRLDYILCDNIGCQEFVHIKCVRYHRQYKTNTRAINRTFYCQACMKQFCISNL